MIHGWFEHDLLRSGCRRQRQKTVNPIRSAAGFSGAAQYETTAADKGADMNSGDGALSFGFSCRILVKNVPNSISDCRSQPLCHWLYVPTA